MNTGCCRGDPSAAAIVPVAALFLHGVYGQDELFDCIVGH